MDKIFSWNDRVVQGSSSRFYSVELKVRIADYAGGSVFDSAVYDHLDGKVTFYRESVAELTYIL